MQTTLLLQTLKKCLKAQGKTYADVAEALDLSEASVKRMFSEQQFSLQRLDSVCNMLGLEISDLVKQMDASQAKIEQLTRNQEIEIIQDMELTLVTVCVFNHWTIDDITQYFTLSHEECIGKLLKLDKIGIIELLSHNKIKLLVSPNFSWIEDGPFERFFRDHIGQEYFNSNFRGEYGRLHVLNGSLSPASAAEFQRKFMRLVREFTEVVRDNATLPIEDRKGVTLVLAMRNWDYGLFDHLIRPEHKATA